MNMPKHIRLKPNQVATRAFVVRQTVIARCASSSQLARGGAPGECLRIEAEALGIAKSVKKWSVGITHRSIDVHRLSGPRPGPRGTRYSIPEREIARFKRAIAIVSAMTFDAGLRPVEELKRVNR